MHECEAITQVSSSGVSCVASNFGPLEADLTQADVTQLWHLALREDARAPTPKQSPQTAHTRTQSATPSPKYAAPLGDGRRRAAAGRQTAGVTPGIRPYARCHCACTKVPRRL